MSGLPGYFSLSERIWYYLFRLFCGCIFFFLIFPIFVIVPLSFNAVPYFSFTSEMLTLDPQGYSLRWYEDFFTNPNWLGSVKNSFIIAFFSTLIATVLGTLAALGLSHPRFPFRTLVMGILISPMIVPLIITAAGMFFFYSRIHLQGHARWGRSGAYGPLHPLRGDRGDRHSGGIRHDPDSRGSQSGSLSHSRFPQDHRPFDRSRVISGALLAFITSFDEVVVVLFVGSFKQRTIPWQMFSGIREQISPTILAVATMLILFSIILLITLEWLRHRNERLRGIKPS